MLQLDIFSSMLQPHAAQRRNTSNSSALCLEMAGGVQNLLKPPRVHLNLATLPLIPQPLLPLGEGGPEVPRPLGEGFRV